MHGVLLHILFLGLDYTTTPQNSHSFSSTCTHQPLFRPLLSQILHNKQQKILLKPLILFFHLHRLNSTRPLCVCLSEECFFRDNEEVPLTIHILLFLLQKFLHLFIDALQEEPKHKEKICFLFFG